MDSSDRHPSDLSDRVASLEVLLFDLDGTLIDTIEMILSSARYATETVLGEALPDDVLRHNIGVPLVVQMEEYAPGRSAELLKVYREHNARVHDEMIREFPGVDETLRSLAAKGFRMGIVTSKSRPVAQRGLDHFGLGELFEVLVGYEDTEVHKPDPCPVLEAASRFGVSAEQVPVLRRQPARHGRRHRGGRHHRRGEVGAVRRARAGARAGLSRSKRPATWSICSAGTRAKYRLG